MSTTCTISSRAEDIRRQIAEAPRLRVAEFFTLKTVAVAAQSKVQGKGFDGGDNFILDDEKWRKLQLYVKSSQSLPTNKQSLAAEFGDNVEDALGTTLTRSMLDVYSTVADHCTSFQNDYDQVVTLANDVVSYAKDTKTYYPKIDDLFKIIVDGTDRADQQKAATNLRAVFLGLCDRTTSRAAKVEHVFQFVEAFNQDTGRDHIQVTKMSARVTEEGSTTSDRIKRIQKDINEKGKQLQNFNKEYEDALEKQRLTAAYVWIPIFGWIAGPVVSGQAAAEAKEAYRNMERLNNELAQLDRDLRTAERLKQTVSAFSNQVDGVTTKMEGALDALATMSAAWSRMSDDFKEIVEKLEAWQEHLDIFAQWDFEAEKEKWDEIGRLADDYVSRAFVKVIKA